VYETQSFIDVNTPFIFILNVVISEPNICKQYPLPIFVFYGEKLPLGTLHFRSSSFANVVYVAFSIFSHFTSMHHMYDRYERLTANNLYIFYSYIIKILVRYTSCPIANGGEQQIILILSKKR
jgi:hypothetical protein